MCSVANEVRENSMYKLYHKRMGQEYGGLIPHSSLRLDSLHCRNTDKYIFGMVLRKIASDTALREIKNINNGKSLVHKKAYCKNRKLNKIHLLPPFSSTT